MAPRGVLRAYDDEGTVLTMARHASLFRDVIRDAHLPDAAAEREFWEAALPSSAKVRHAYRSYGARVPVKKGVILYEAMSGDRMTDSPLAIFEYLSAHPEYGNYLHVWSLGPHGTVPTSVAERKDVAFVPRTSRAYAYFLATAEWLVCNANLPGYFARRDEQKYLNTWHGIGYKALGRNTPRARFGAPPGTASFLKATHVITPCEFATQSLTSAYSMEGTSTAVIAETGYPRVDLTVNATPEQVRALHRSVGIDERRRPSDPRPVVLFAPTWRTHNDEAALDTDQLVGDLAALAALDIQLVYRGHHRVDRVMRDEALSAAVGTVVVPPREINSNVLLAGVDILITDYSSIFFDFLPTGRPIVHYIYDVSEYARKRGLSLGQEELPGAVAKTREELVAAVKSCVEALNAVDSYTDLAARPVQGERYANARARFAPWEDGHSSQRAVDFFFRGVTDGVRVRSMRDALPTVAFWAGCLVDRDEVTAFMRDLLSFAEADGRHIALVIDRESDIPRDMLDRLHALKDRIAFIPYDSCAPTLLANERARYSKLTHRVTPTFADVCRVLRDDRVLTNALWYEYRRRLGNAHFDSVVLAPHLPTLELALAAFATHNGPRPAVPSVERRFPRASDRVRRTGPLHRSAMVLLPPGSRRRSYATSVYRKLRRR